MNVIERKISAYIVECLTGEIGENQGYVYDTLRAGVSSKNPFLNLVANIAEENPESQKTKDIVACLTLAKAIKENQAIRDAVKETFEKAEEKKGPDVTLSYSVEGEDMAVVVVWFDFDPQAIVNIPASVLPKTIEMFKEKFPDGTVLNADE